jgi:hypothetical protein
MEGENSTSCGAGYKNPTELDPTDINPMDVSPNLESRLMAAGLM